MATDHELWALTLKVERDHGEGAPLYIAEKLSLAAASGDPVGIGMWNGVADRYGQLNPLDGEPGDVDD
jgi:hypothetical protein